MRKIHALLLFCSIFFGSNLKSQTALYADAGTGTMRNYISWFNWDGFTVANGASKTFTTSDGLSVTISFSGVSASPVVPYVMNTWSGAVLWKLYDFTNPAIKPALYSDMTLNAVSFQMNVTATRDGAPAPFTFIAADAEASDATEVMTLSTNGTAWRTIEFYRNSGQTSNPVGGCGTQTVTVTQTYGGATATGQNPILATDASGSLIINTNFNRTAQGNMAVAFGIFSPIDRGDLPSPYAVAHHALAFTTTNSCNFNPPYPSITQTNHVYLGTQPGDADGAQTTNDNASGADEDGVSVFPAYLGNGTYTLNLAVRNTSPVAAVATLKGWFDYNRDGVFSVGESAAVFVPGAATTATLTWSGLPATLPAGAQTDFAFRFRISFNGTQIFNPSGYASDGEVEDYLIQNTVVAPAIPANASFTAPDTVCVGQTFTITNNSTNADTHLWNFCQQPFSSTPTGTNLGNPGGFGIPVYTDYYFENGNYYGLMVNNTPGGLVRLNFGNSLLNTPTPTPLGNFGGAIPNAAQGIQIVKNGSEILAIIVGGDPIFGTSSRILKLSFGTTITNPAPVMTNWGNPGGLMNYPHDINVFKSGSNWYGFTTNFHSSTLTRFNFGTDFSGTPTASDLGTLNLQGPTGFIPVINNGNSYLFVANWSGSSVTRIDFGNSFLNGPVSSTNFGNLGALSSTRDVLLFTECGEVTGYALNGNSSLVRLNFSSITSSPTATNLGNIGSLNGPHSFSRPFRSGSNVYSFIPNNANNTFSRLAFSGSCSSVSTQTSTLGSPPAISYTAPGTYTISLIVNEGAVTQSSFCKQVVAMPQLTHSPTQTFSSCGPVRIGSSIKPATYLWNTGATTDSITVTTPGTYWVESSRYGCTVRDSFQITLDVLPIITITNDTTVCGASNVQLNASGGVAYVWSPSTGLSSTTIANPVAQPTTTIEYKVTVTGANGCQNTDSVTITVLPLPVFSISPATQTVCAGTTVTLTAAGGDTYNWSPAPGITNPSSPSITVTPGTTTNYSVNVSHSACKMSQTLNAAVQVNALPSVTITKDTTVCGTANVQLLATGGATYLWSPGTGLSSTTSPNPVASPTATTKYKVTVTGANGCQKQDSVTITVNPLPVFNITPATQAICAGSPVTITASGGDVYNWTPATGITNPAQPAITLTPTASGSYTVNVSHTACKTSQNLTAAVQVNPLPNVAVTKSGDVTCSQPQSQLNATGGTTYQWTPAAGLSNPTIPNPIASPTTNTVYTVKVGTAQGCFAEKMITVNFLGGSGATLYIPNAFSPNNDGLNDEFKVFFPGVQKFNLKIFNGWGEKVFETKDISKGWNGVYKGRKQGTDVFVYVMTAEGVCGGSIFRKGSIMLIR